MAQQQSYRMIRADITKLECEAIVNAANKSLLGGGGVDGAIHFAAGPELLKECRTLNGCNTGEAKITKGYLLPAKYIIHTVGPEYRGMQEDAVLLRNCYYNSLELAKENNIHSIAFPAISTGIYGYPIEAATEIAIRTVKSWFKDNSDYDMEVIFCCYSQADLVTYVKTDMKVNKNKIEKKFLIALKQAYINYDCSYIVNKIADNLTYSSFWVLSSINSAEEYLNYLAGKLNTQRKSNYKSDFCIVRQVKTGKPILLLTPKTPQGDYGCFIAECDDNGLISKLDIMPSSFYKWEADDVEEFEEFQDRNINK